MKFVVVASGIKEEPTLSPSDTDIISATPITKGVIVLLVQEDLEPGESFKELLIRLRQKYAELFVTNKITLVAV